MKQHYDMLVVGSGPAGQRAAIQAAKLGKNVGLIERKAKIGGAGLQSGTIPSKALREVAYAVSHSGSMGMREAIAKDATVRRGFLAEAIRKKNMVVDQQESVVLNQLLRNGVALIPGKASFVDEHSLIVQKPRGEKKLLHADAIVLATGSRPRRPKHVPFDKERVLDSTSILHLHHLPKHLVIVGGGVIACEFACIFAALNVQVTMIDPHPQILTFLSQDIAIRLSNAMFSMGIEFHMQTEAKSIELIDDGVRVHTSAEQILESDCLLYAMGREANIDDLGIDQLGLEQDKRGWLSVNDYFQTAIPHIYAVGDLIGRPALAATGMEQGRIAAIHACDAKSTLTADHLPMAIYTIPELSFVGQTEAQLKEKNVDYVVGHGHFKESARGQIIGDNDGMLKLLVDRQSRKVLGVHIIGESASELVHIGQIVMNIGANIDCLVENVFNYPTLAECYKMAALECTNQL